MQNNVATAMQYNGLGPFHYVFVSEKSYRNYVILSQKRNFCSIYFVLCSTFTIFVGRYSVEYGFL